MRSVWCTAPCSPEPALTQETTMRPEETPVGQRIRAPGPKKILTLDGGGILGLMSVEVLARIEEMLRTRLRKGPEFVLADYFDLVAGTSTGAVLAACIALGMPMTRVRGFYLESGKEMFDRASLLKRFRYKYEEERLVAKLQQELGADTLLGSPKLRCMFLAVMRNATTDSPWPVTNNPFAKYNLRERPDCNLDLPLWQLVRASTAAPTYFPPERVTIGPRRFVFVDGGVTPYNNPAFMAFLTATVEPYRVSWQTGEDRLLLVSVGTGNAAKANADLEPRDMHLLYNAQTIPSALIFGAQNQQDMLCRVFGKCLVGDPIDREIGDLFTTPSPLGRKAFTYLRYDADVSRDGLNALGLTDVEPEHVQLMDSVGHIAEIQRVGKAVADRSVKAEHYEGFA
jgi:patatin-like phospholipase/acyl hydrolase